MEEGTIIETIRDKDGFIKNNINYQLFNSNFNLENPYTYPDIYLAFLLKTIIDDFGDNIVRSKRGLNKEQFEAILLKNLTDLLNTKTRVE